MAIRSGMSNKAIRGLSAGIVGVSLALVLWASGLIDAWEAKSWDWRVALMAKPGKATDSISLILLDQKSLDWGKDVNALTWPWPREIYGAIVNFCRRSGARAVAFDVLFTEPSKYGVEDDAAFAQAVSDFGQVALAAFLSNQSGNNPQWPAAVPLPGFKTSGLDNLQNNAATKFRTFSLTSMPIEPLARQAAILCNVSLNPDPDGIYRKVDLLSIFDGKVLPSLGLGAFLAGNPEASLELQPGNLRVGGQKIPVDRNGYAILRYRGPSGTHKVYNAAAVLQSEIQILNGEQPNIRDPKAFKDKYVFFGFSAPGLYDLRPSPISGVFPGVEIYATLLDNLLSGDFIRQLPVWMSIVLLFVLSLICAVSLTYAGSTTSTVTSIAVFISLPALLAFGAYHQGFWLPIVVVETSIVVTIGLVLLINYATEGRQKRFIKNAFKHFLSPEVIEQLIVHPERLQLGGERRVLTIFFSDLEGFTSISENLDPEELIELLNDYLSAMTDIIQEEGGTIDKYEGDAIIAFWNAPLEVADHAVRAVRTALRCQAKLAEMRPAFRDRVGTDMHMRIGINTGLSVVGNLGSHTRFDYTVLGDAVNLASRLEGANKQFGTYTMISQSTCDFVDKHFAVRELARLTVVGRKEPVNVYEPMSSADYESRAEILDTFGRGLAFFYKGDIERGKKVFAEIEEQDPAAAAYAEKCRSLIGTDLEHWNGVWVMKTK
ncbi:MAG: adenylate/guanylate cyclase domain-containing protein [Desulfobacterales bacterium]|jgi:adenylate cyclase